MWDMENTRKVKISVTIDADLLAEIDRYTANSDGQTRSSVIESWLRRGARKQAALKLEKDTIAYYQSLTAEQREEDNEWSEASSRQFSKLEID